MTKSNEQSPRLSSTRRPGGLWPESQRGRAGATPVTGPVGAWNKVKLVLGAGLYVVVFLWAYATIVSPAFAYDGCTLAWPGTWDMVWLITAALLPALFLTVHDLAAIGSDPVVALSGGLHPVDLGSRVNP